MSRLESLTSGATTQGENLSNVRAGSFPIGSSQSLVQSDSFSMVQSPTSPQGHELLMKKRRGQLNRKYTEVPVPTNKTVNEILSSTTRERSHSPGKKYEMMAVSCRARGWTGLKLINRTEGADVSDRDSTSLQKNT